ncbi:hypothetical protein GCM10020218_002190 [Dactylosporangium vinaceum]
MVAAAPDPGDGGVEHEPVDGVAVERGVEVQGTVHLGRERLVEVVSGRVGDLAEDADPGRVHDGADRAVLGLDDGDERGEGGHVGDVALRDGDACPEGGQLVAERLGAGCVDAAPADQHEVAGALGGQPAGGLGAEAGGAAGHERDAARAPHRRGAGGGDPGEAADADVAAADGELVLRAVRTAEDGSQRGPVGRSGVGGQVDEATPAVGVLEGGDPAEAPDGGPQGVGDGVVGDGRGGDVPQRGGDAGVAEGLEQHERVEGGGGLGDHAGGAGAGRGPQPLGEQGAVGGGGDQDRVGPAAGERLGEGGAADDEPAPGDPVGPGRRGPPLLPVGPAAGRRGGPAVAVEPVPLPLERIGRQLDRRRGTEDLRPVRRPAPGVGPAECGHERLGLVAVLARDGDPVLDERGQHRVRPDLQEPRHAFLPQRLHPVGEPHGLPHLPHPVIRFRQISAEIPSHIGHHGDGGSLRRHRRHHSPELLQHPVHVGRVERMRDIQPPRLHTQRRRNLLHITRQHHRVRPVHRRDLSTVHQRRPRSRLIGLHGDHLPTRRQRLHQPATRLHNPARTIQIPHPGDMRRRQLTDRMPEQEIRPQAPRLQQPENSDLERKQRRLRPPRLIQILSIPQTSDAITHRVIRRREHRERLVQPATHVRPLGTLTGEQHRRQALADLAADHGAAEHDRAMLQLRAGGGQGEPHVDRVGGHGPQPRQRNLQCGPGAGGDRPGHDRQCRAGERRGHRGRRLLQDDVRVGAARAEGRDPDAAGAAGGGPVARRVEQGDRSRGPVHPGRRHGGVQGPGQAAVAHGQDRLDDPGDAGRGLRVPDVRLERAQPQRVAGVPALPVGRQQRLGLDRVAEGGAGAVGLHRVHVGRLQARVGERGPDDPLLRRPVRGGEPVGGAVLVDGGALDDGQDAVPEPLGVAEPLDEQHADALAPAGPVGVVGERLAAPVRGQAALAAELDERLRHGHHGGPADEGEPALAEPQRAHRQVQRDERRGAHGVDGDGRAVGAERVGEPAGEHGGGAAGEQVPLGALGRELGCGAVALVAGADEHAGVGALQRLRRQPGPFEGLPGGLQQQPLLRVHGQGLAR